MITFLTASTSNSVCLKQNSNSANDCFCSLTPISQKNILCPFHPNSVTLASSLSPKKVKHTFYICCNFCKMMLRSFEIFWVERDAGL